MIPLVDVKANNASLEGELEAAVSNVVREAAFILGPAVERFERAFAEYLGVKHVLGLQSGTAALQLALLAKGIGRGDEVVIPAMTFFATGEAVSLTGATPVFVDVDPVTLTMDVAELESAVTSATKAIVPVHLYGQAANLGAIGEVAAKRGIPVIEDACQAHGASWNGRKVGSIGDAAAFSFYPGKNLGCWGEGGALATNDDALAAKVRLLRDHGSPKKYEHAVIGFNYRMEGIQGAVLGVKLPHLDGWNARRRALAKRYSDALARVGDLVLPVARNEESHVWHLYSVRTRRREKVFASFEKHGIARAIHYPTPLHLLDAYRGLGVLEGAYPVSEAAGRDSLSLPLYPELDEAKQDAVIAAVKEAFR